MEQLNAIAVYDTQHRGRCQKAITPVLVNSEQAKETSTVWQSRKHVLMVACEPAIESPVAHPFDGVEQAYGDYLTRPQIGLAMLGYLFHLVVYSAKQFSDKILCSHMVPPLSRLRHYYLGSTI